MSNDFQSRLLYTQKTAATINEDEPVSVSSTIYAIRFLYPGATQHTTGRLRITCTYRESDQFESHAGIIERWSDKGWILVDDYTDDIYAFHSEEDFRKRLLDFAQAFTLGIPLNSVDSGYSPDYPSSPMPRTTKTVRAFDVETKTTNKKEKITSNKKDNYSGSSNNDDDDLDFV